MKARLLQARELFRSRHPIDAAQGAAMSKHSPWWRNPWLNVVDVDVFKIIFDSRFRSHAPYCSSRLQSLSDFGMRLFESRLHGSSLWLMALFNKTMIGGIEEIAFVMVSQGRRHAKSKLLVRRIGCTASSQRKRESWPDLVYETLRA